jgi:hypothetical protein
MAIAVTAAMGETSFSYSIQKSATAIIATAAAICNN